MSSTSCAIGTRRRMKRRSRDCSRSTTSAIRWSGSGAIRCGAALGSPNGIRRMTCPDIVGGAMAIPCRAISLSSHCVSGPTKRVGHNPRMDVRRRAPRWPDRRGTPVRRGTVCVETGGCGRRRSCEQAVPRRHPHFRHISVVWSAAAAEARIGASGRDGTRGPTTGDAAAGRTRTPRTSGRGDSRRSRAGRGDREGEPKDARDRVGPVVGADRRVSVRREDRDVGGGRVSPRRHHRRQAAADRAGRQDLVLAAAVVGSEAPRRPGVWRGQRRRGARVGDAAGAVRDCRRHADGAAGLRRQRQPRRRRHIWT